MTIFYVNPVGGSNALDGQSFANAWLDITNGATLARITAGDEIRIMESPTFTLASTGVAWTNQSPTVTLDTNTWTKNVTMCESNWTAVGANSSTTTSSFLKEGSTNVQITLATNATGLIAYFPLGSTEDFSDYDSLSFWIRPSANTSANNVRLVLCSDAAGATPVSSVTINGAIRSSTLYPLTLNSGGAMGASVQSVALYVDNELSTRAFILDDIIACNFNSLCLNSVIAPVNSNSNSLWAIRSINDTTIKLDVAAQVTTSTAGRGWSSSNGLSIAASAGGLYGMNGYLQYWTGSGPLNAVNDTGTSSLPIVYTGGWDSGSMSSQSGETLFDGLSGDANGIDPNGNNYNYVNLDMLSFVRCAYGIQTNGTGWSIGNSNTDGKIRLIAMTNGGINVLGSGTEPFHSITSQRTYINQGNSSTPIRFDSSTSQLVFVNPTDSIGSANLYLQSYQSGGGNYGTTGQILSEYGGYLIQTSNHSGDGIRFTCGVDMPSGEIVARDNSGLGVNFSPTNGNFLIGGGITAINNGSHGVQFAGAGNVKIGTYMYTEGNTTGFRVQNATSGQIVAYDYNYWEATGWNLALQDYSSFTVYSQDEENGAGPALSTITRVDGGTFTKDTANNHAASGNSWAIVPTSVIRNLYYPLRFPLGTHAVDNLPATFDVSCWVYATGTSVIGARIVAVQANIAEENLNTANFSGAYSAFEQLTASITVSEQSDSTNNAINVYLEVYHISGTVGNSTIWVSDFNITEA